MRRRELLLAIGTAALGRSLALRAQGKPTPRIGYLNGTTPDANAVSVAAFRRGLSETGFIEGHI
jgi:putative tryptophan/tyrosine transport system substrate-binding protein